MMTSLQPNQMLTNVFNPLDFFCPRYSKLFYSDPQQWVDFGSNLFLNSTQAFWQVYLHSYQSYFGILDWQLQKARVGYQEISPLHFLGEWLHLNVALFTSAFNRTSP